MPMAPAAKAFWALVSKVQVTVEGLRWMSAHASVSEPAGSGEHACPLSPSVVTSTKVPELAPNVDGVKMESPKAAVMFLRLAAMPEPLTDTVGLKMCELMVA